MMQSFQHYENQKSVVYTCSQWINTLDANLQLSTFRHSVSAGFINSNLRLFEILDLHHDRNLQKQNCIFEIEVVLRVFAHNECNIKGLTTGTSQRQRRMSSSHLAINLSLNMVDAKMLVS